jgi:hypothetical protein
LSLILHLKAPLFSQAARSAMLEFCGESIDINLSEVKRFNISSSLSKSVINAFVSEANNANLEDVIVTLQSYRQASKADDWLFYQLIRKVAQHISPKAENYQLYTLYKWYLLSKCGYDALLSISGDKVLFYVRCDENTYNIPNIQYLGKQYACLNYHDYPGLNLNAERFDAAEVPIKGALRTFSYQITSLPHFKASEYTEKKFRFTYNENEYDFKIKLNPHIKTIFANYPVVDFASYLNIPLSRETYQSLIPLLKKHVKGLSKKNGVDYLMRFTRYAFLFETDSKNFGSEKRLSPEQTLLHEQSDCEDRVALFYCLVKEIYDLPMIVLLYANHVTIAVKFDKPSGIPVIYNGKQYTICEPTPQKTDLRIGELMPELYRESYEISYVYEPQKR